ncbi:MAG TPA: N-formylglutamate amidohydrolase [Alphaproteobacteria bacterium]|nr:N-formylglutamate amidohydrolase [Alphaproteobacteria bacterium]
MAKKTVKIKKKTTKTAAKATTKAKVKVTAATQKTRVVTPKKATKKPAAKLTKRLLTKADPAPFRVENQKGKAQCLIVCDHASNRIPAVLGTLGLSKKDREKHIAWDPGTEVIGRYLSEQLDAPAFFATFSRIVVDVNRGANSPECMREVYDHVSVPGNTNLSRAEKKQRIDEIFNPYHKNLADQVQRFLKKKRVPMIISVHSFTPEMDGYRRPWHIGILWNKEDDIALRLVDNLRLQNPTMIVGENEPYSLKAENLTKNTIGTHAESKGLPYVIVEFRQDLVKTKRDALKWGKIFLDAMAPILADPDTYRLYRARVGKSASKSAQKKTIFGISKKPAKHAAAKSVKTARKQTQ